MRIACVFIHHLAIQIALAEEPGLRGEPLIIGGLSFETKPVIDYIIIHELAHLKEMNHSKNFWKLVAEHCPQWRKHRKWLKDHEAELSTKLPG